MALAPPGPSSLAMVVSRWKISIAVSFMAEKSSRGVIGWQISNVLILWADYESARHRVVER